MIDDGASDDDESGVKLDAIAYIYNSEQYRSLDREKQNIVLEKSMKQKLTTLEARSAEKSKQSKESAQKLRQDLFPSRAFGSPLVTNTRRQVEAKVIDKRISNSSKKE